MDGPTEVLEGGRPLLAPHFLGPCLEGHCNKCISIPDLNLKLVTGGNSHNLTAMHTI